MLVIDDNNVSRSGLVIFIDTFDDLQLVGEGRNGEDAIELCTQVHPDIVLMDLKMPIMDDITATRIIGQKYPFIKVIALTSFDEEPLVQSAKQAGVYDYLLKNISIDRMADVIRQAYTTSKMS